MDLGRVLFQGTRLPLSSNCKTLFAPLRRLQGISPNALMESVQQSTELLYGDPAGIRTQDTRLKRAVLYRLSYRVIWDNLLPSTAAAVRDHTLTQRLGCPWGKKGMGLLLPHPARHKMFQKDHLYILYQSISKLSFRNYLLYMSC